jgi:hypothetical protein
MRVTPDTGRQCGRHPVVVQSKDGNPHIYYALVESVRTDLGPRQRIVAYLGELNHDQQRRWQRAVVFHNQQGEAQQLRLYPDDSHVILPDDPDVVRIRLSSVEGRRPLTKLLNDALDPAP